MKSSLIAFLEKIRTSDPSPHDIDALVQEIMPLTAGLQLDVPEFAPGTLLFRGRSCAKVYKVGELSYPPSISVGMGRLNREGSPLFYSSNSRGAVFFEIGAKSGDQVLVSRWRTKKPMLLNHLGYHSAVFEQLGSARTVASWDGRTELHERHPESHEALRAMGELFAERIDRANESRYALSVAVAECMLNGPFAGLLYPSIAMFANADNIALRSSWADENLTFVGVEAIRIDEIIGDKWQAQVVDYAVAKDGVNLEWKGRGPVWQLQDEGEQLRMESTGEYWRAFNTRGEEVDPE